jgi:hypothetical protein
MKNFSRRQFLVATPAFLFGIAAHAELSVGQKKIDQKWLSEIKRLPGILVGSKNKEDVVANIFFDPNCKGSAELWRMLYPSTVSSHQLITKWIPVAYMNSSSAPKAASILSKDSIDELTANFSKFDFSRQMGGSSEKLVSDEMEKLLGKNYASWNQLGDATPLLVFKTNDGSVIRQIGLPSARVLRLMMSSWSSGRLENFSR